MELRQLQYLRHIARVSGFRRAADELDMSQATLSEQIKLLEQELGVRLFERGGRNLALTEAGRTLLARRRPGGIARLYGEGLADHWRHARVHKGDQDRQRKDELEKTFQEARHENILWAGRERQMSNARATWRFAQ